MKMPTRSLTLMLAASLAAGGFAAPSYAQAQRDPAYAAARADGSVGERTDGYLGIVGSGTPGLRALVNDINIKRRAIYTERANAVGFSLERYSAMAGCKTIAATAVGEMYQAPDGSWQKRTASAPQLSPDCANI